MSTRESDVLIIGAGLAGSAAAIRLARAGRRVRLLEKEAVANHKVCGEFISGEGVPYLSEAGIDLEDLGATTVARFRLHGPRRTAEAGLPRTARGISRLVLDEAMLDCARRAGAEIERGVTVRDFEAVRNGSRGASHIVCATGKTEFKGIAPREGRDAGLVGFKMHLRLGRQTRAHIDNHVDLFVFEGGYGGLVSIEEGKANLCFLVRREHVKDFPREWSRTALELGRRSPALRRYLEDSEPLWPQAVTIARVPYGFVRATPVAENVYCIGDQLAVIPSLTGDGMTIALMSARRASDYILEGGGAAAFHCEMEPLLRRQVGVGFYAHRLFARPELCDWVVPVLNRIPLLFQHVFEKTRSPGRGSLPPLAGP